MRNTAKHVWGYTIKIDAPKPRQFADILAEKYGLERRISPRAKPGASGKPRFAINAASGIATCRGETIKHSEVRSDLAGKLFYSTNVQLVEQEPFISVRNTPLRCLVDVSRQAIVEFPGIIEQLRRDVLVNYRHKVVDVCLAVQTHSLRTALGNPEWAIGRFCDNYGYDYQAVKRTYFPVLGTNMWGLLVGLTFDLSVLGDTGGSPHHNTQVFSPSVDNWSQLEFNRRLGILQSMVGPNWYNVVCWFAIKYMRLVDLNEHDMAARVEQMSYLPGSLEGEGGVP